MRILFLTTLLLGANTWVQAQFDSLNSVDLLKLDELNLHSNRLSQNLNQTGLNVEVIEMKSFRKKYPVQSLNEVLTYVSGIDLRQRGPAGIQADLGIRGSGSDQVLVLVNGVRMSDPQTGHHQLNLPIPLDLIERIEVIKGPMARRYGLNALSGVINVVLKSEGSSNHPDGIHANLETWAGAPAQNDSVRYSAWGYRAGISIQKKQHNLWYSTEGMMGNGYRPNTEFENFRNFLGYTWASKKHYVNVMASLINNDFGASYFYAAPNDHSAKEFVRTRLLSAKYGYKLSQNLSLNAVLSNRNNFDHYIYYKPKPELYQNKHTNVVNMLELNLVGKSKWMDYSFGVENRQEQIESNNLGNHLRQFTGSFAEFSPKLGPKFHATAGIYAMWGSGVTTNKFDLFPGLDVRYSLNKSLDFWGCWGVGQRLPTFTDLYYTDKGNRGNPLLKSENAQSVEVGLKGKIYGSRFQVSMFRKDVYRMIDWFRDSINQPWFPENLGTQMINGLEANINLPIGQKISWNTNATYMSGVMNEGVNQFSKLALNFVKLQIVSSLNVQWTKNFNTSLALRHIERINNDAYQIVDARINYQLKNAGIYLNVNNLGNVQYREIQTVPMMPRWVYLGFKVNI
jgi:iron complex outermembrane receptor protein